jgi:hypothetical protein
LYRRCKEYDILPSRDGKESYLSADELQILTSHQTRRGELSVLGEAKHREGLALQQKQVDAIELVQAIAQLLPQFQKDIFEPQRQLGIAAAHRWLLSTAQLSELLNLSPKTIRRGCDRFGFKFERVGRHWRVLSAPKN